ncbi:MAG: Holliday junction resolvase RuvX [Flammeovirgaceae bacterium]
MARIIAIDYGTKRTGLAVTDPLQMIAHPLEAIASHELISFLKAYFQQEQVESIVLGFPKNLDGGATDATPHVLALQKKLQITFPDKPIHLVDERMTSKLASQALFLGGMKKKNRQIKGNIDKVSATIILQSYLETRANLK